LKNLPGDSLDEEFSRSRLGLALTGLGLLFELLLSITLAVTTTAFFLGGQALWGFVFLLLTLAFHFYSKDKA